MFSALFPASAPHPYPIPVNVSVPVLILYMILFLLLSLIFFMLLLLPLLLYLFTFSHWSFPAKIFYKSSVLANWRQLDMLHLLKIRTASMSISIPINSLQTQYKLFRNGSYVAKSIECSNYKQGRTYSFIKQILNKIIQFLPCQILALHFGRILNHIE